MKSQISRRAALGSLLGTTPFVLAACGLAAPKAASDVIRPEGTSVFGHQLYDRALAGRVAGITLVSPHLSSTEIYFGHANNWLNAMANDYALDPGGLRVVMANWGPMNFITFNDEMWHKYAVGEWQSILDPVSGRPAKRNVFASQVAQLQQRRAIFLTCRNTLISQAGQAARMRGIPVGTVVADFEANLLPGAYLVPAVVVEITRLALLGLPYQYMPKDL